MSSDNNAISANSPEGQRILGIAGLIGKILTVLFGIGALLVGILFLNVANFSDKHYENLSKNGVKTIATSTAIKTKTESSSSSTTNGKRSNKTTTYEVKTFTYNVSGTDYTIERKDRKGSSPAQKGEKANVFYAKADPAKSVFERTGDNGKGSQVIPIIFITVGSLMVLGGGLAFFKRRRS